MKRPRITLQDWLQFLEYKASIRFTHVLAVFTAALSLLVFIVAVLSLTKDVILWFGITFDNLVLVVYSLFITVFVSWMWFYSESARIRKLADEILNDILVTKRYKNIEEIEEAWKQGINIIKNLNGDD